MPTLGEALDATLSAEAVEASLVHVVAGLRTTENAYVSPRDGIAHSHTRFEMTDADDHGSRGTDRRGESIAHRGALHLREARGDNWVRIDLPRPALGPLALLTVLFGSESQQPLTADLRSVEVVTARALERVPDHLHSTLDDILSPRPEAGVVGISGTITARLSIHAAPLHISEMTMTVNAAEATETFALKIHPVPQRKIDIPTAAGDAD